MPVVNTLYNMFGPIELAWNIPLDCSNVYVRVLADGEQYPGTGEIWFNDYIDAANGRPIYVTCEANPQADGVIPYNISPYSVKKDIKSVELTNHGGLGGHTFAQLAIPIQNFAMYTSLLPHFRTVYFKLKIVRDGEVNWRYNSWGGMFIHEIENDRVKNSYNNDYQEFTQIYMDGKDYSQGNDYYTYQTDELHNGHVMLKRLEGGYRYIYYRPDEVDQMWLVVEYMCPQCNNPQGIWYITEEGARDTSNVVISDCSILCSRYSANPSFDPI